MILCHTYLSPTHHIAVVLLGQVHTGFPRINKCHDFSWSRSLWGAATISIAGDTTVVLVAYLTGGYFLLSRKEDLGALDSFYLMAASMTTVRRIFSLPPPPRANPLAMISIRTLLITRVV